MEFAKVIVQGSPVKSIVINFLSKYKKSLIALVSVLLVSVLISTNTLCGCESDSNEFYSGILDRIITEYHMKHGHLPKTLDEINRNIKIDPWDREVKYILEPKLVIVNSSGADGMYGTVDDFVFSKDFNRLPKE